MEYKGYNARVEFDQEDEIFVGRIVGINDVVGFHAASVDALKEAFQEAVDDYVETCKAVGKKPEKEYSGQLSVRISPNVHKQVVQAAELKGVSINKYAEELFSIAASGVKDLAEGGERSWGHESFRRSTWMSAQKLLVARPSGDVCVFTLDALTGRVLQEEDSKYSVLNRIRRRTRQKNVPLKRSYS
jgi:predicted HicB family RNase H-like nuclease